ncbi:YbaB/EbfC family nucleoid-associated protein [Micromonospora globbae]|uniref:YbaB/EbfC family nucleoid-associated protein n=1 Tax=Micromonospora globbae TaxID=1894969 RepID=UPI0037BD41FC
MDGTFPFRTGTVARNRWGDMADGATTAARQRRVLAAATEFGAAIGATRVTVESPDGAVVVTVGPGNAVLDLALTRRIRQHDGRSLGALIVSTVRTAVDRATQELAARARELAPDRPDLPGLLTGALPAPPAPHSGDTTGAAAGPTGTGAAGTGGGVAGVPGDELAAGARRLSAEADRQLDAYAAAWDELAVLTATAHSPDGGVTAVVRAGGALERVELHDSLLRGEPAGLAALVLATVHRATAEASRRMAERVQQAVGPRLDVMALVTPHLPAEGADEEGRA